MTKADLLTLFRSKCDEIGQAEVARQIGMSPSTVCQLYNGSYKADSGAVLQVFAEVFTGETVTCPEMGEIPLKRCAEERKVPFNASSARRVRMFNACRQCPHNRRG